jgi:hypothetical protein
MGCSCRRSLAGNCPRSTNDTSNIMHVRCMLSELAAPELGELVLLELLAGARANLAVLSTRRHICIRMR